MGTQRCPVATHRAGVREGSLERILRFLAEGLQGRGKLELEEAFIGASFTGAKRGASRSGHQARQRIENHRSGG
jgi:hypothetical protein